MPPLKRAAAVSTLIGGEKLDLRFNAAQHIETPIGSAWVVSNEKGTACLFRNDATAGACAGASVARESGLMLEVFNSDPGTGGTHNYRLLGIVPDSLRAVRIRAGTVEAKLPVDDNAYGYRADDPINLVP